MRLLMLTDLHGRADLIGKMESIFNDADLVILAGDITHFGRREQAAQIIGNVRKYHSRILAVSGNCDYPDVEAYLQQECLSLHCKTVEMEGYCFAGLSGSLHCPGKTPNEFSEAGFAGFIDQIRQERTSKLPLILVTHQPPFKTRNDRVLIGMHVGSKVIRNFIEEEKPLLCLCGHIHEGTGTDYIGDTLTVNPGPFSSGHYAVIELNGTNVSVEIKDFPKFKS